jgi:hypothetical protein
MARFGYAQRVVVILSRHLKLTANNQNWRLASAPRKPRNECHSLTPVAAQGGFYFFKPVTSKRYRFR